MALQVTGEYATPIGTTVTSVYWRWVGLGIDVSRATANVTLYGYVDAAAFAAGKTPIDQKQVSLSGAEFLAVANSIDGAEPVGLSQAIYSHVIANVDGFADATEV
jgi:hypothetical protein